MKAWKVEEQRVAALFGWRRRHGSGSDVLTGKSDVVKPDGGSPELFIEVKSWKHMPLIKTIEKVRQEAAQEAKREGKETKPWVLAIHEKGSQNRFAVVDLEWLVTTYRSGTALPRPKEDSII